jgi:hypothetical protein
VQGSIFDQPLVAERVHGLDLQATVYGSNPGADRDELQGDGGTGKNAAIVTAEGLLQRPGEAVLVGGQAGREPLIRGASILLSSSSDSTRTMPS